MLDSICINIGISYEQFFLSCASGVKSKSHHKTFEQILACDNFLSFKRLMIKRNKQLDQEALKTLPRFTRKKKKVEAEDEVEKAIRLSMEESKRTESIKAIEERELQRALKISEEEYRREQDLLRRAKRSEENVVVVKSTVSEMETGLRIMAEKAKMGENIPAEEKEDSKGIEKMEIKKIVEVKASGEME
jgi:crotonobetainyl-CoA:carnitine CoA-transferase CaiB-like acyl-CoA transferase